MTPRPAFLRVRQLMSKTVKIMIVAGESSGDSHAASLVAALRDAHPGIEFRFFGSAGQKMRDSGVEPVVESEGMAIIGGLEIARELPMFLRAFRALRRAAEKERPDAAVLVDFPDFNLRLARKLKKLGIPVVYYISPQVWAWKKFRVRTIRQNVDLMLSILPFEREFYLAEGFEAVEYVGNPIASEVKAGSSREEFCRRNSLNPEMPLVSLLPGSRKVELKYILPDLLKTAELMLLRDPSIQFVVPLAPARSRSEYEEALASSNVSNQAAGKVTVLTGETYDALNASDAAAVASGTATLEAAVIGTPMAVVYKASGLNYRLLRPFISIDTFGLVNLIAGKRIAAELIQHDLTPENLARELFALLKPDTNRQKREELLKVRESLAGPDASANAARAVWEAAVPNQG